MTAFGLRPYGSAQDDSVWVADIFPHHGNPLRPPHHGKFATALGCGRLFLMAAIRYPTHNHVFA
jgi:hypothetical protein